ncbi:MAG TPA: hypothetical protein ENJ21_06800 [Chromatiaceae bacterium]|nr:hypothetical protein [Chromatiaceae bacterium]
MSGTNLLDEAPDRREYFRIDDAVHFQYRVVADADRAARERCIAQGLECDFTVMSSLAAIGQQSAACLRRIEASNPDVAEYLAMLEKKIDVLGRAFIAHDADLASYRAAPVNISAGGVAMHTSESFDSGAVLELHMLLLPGLHGLICHAQVVSSEAIEDDGGDYAYLTRLNFTYLRDNDRDTLIRHILRKQGEMLRQRRCREEA